MLLNPSETVVGWIHYHTDSISCRTFNLKICSNMSVSGRLPARALWKPPSGKNCVDRDGRHSCQPDLLLYTTQGLLEDRELPFSSATALTPGSGSRAQWVPNKRWLNRNWWNTYNLNIHLWMAKMMKDFFSFSQGKHLYMIKSFLFFLSENENTWLNSFHLSDLSG